MTRRTVTLMKQLLKIDRRILRRAAALMLAIVLLAGTGIFGASQIAYAADGATDTTTIGATDTTTIGAINAEEPIPISSVEDLWLLSDIPNAMFVLTDDIDMSGIDWVPIPFSGTLDGAGHGIYNLKVTCFGNDTEPTVDGNAKVYDSVLAGLFSALDGADIHDLTIRGADIDVRGEQHCFAGVLAGWMKNTRVTGCVIEDSRVTLTAACKPETGQDRRSCNAGVGGIAGFGAAAQTPGINFVSGCRVSVTLIFDDQCDPSLKVEEFLGGIVSAGCVEILDTQMDIHGYASCRGYAHNGGLVGMLYDYAGPENKGTGAELRISGCQVSGSITFFEDNRDRRAYCDPYVGEKMTWPRYSNVHQTFRSNETFNYSATPGPEKCAQPQISDAVTPGSCDAWGYTTHTCAGCGNTWADTFTPRVHEPGNWETVATPIGGSDGLKVRRCVKCGEIAEQQVIVAIKSISLGDGVLEINYKDSAHIDARIEPQDAEGPALRWTSSDDGVAVVSNNGYVTATGRGEAIITCATDDGVVYACRTVRVGYSVGQWLIKILLFGWIWY